MTSKPCKYENADHSLYHLGNALPKRGREVNFSSQAQNKYQTFTYFVLNENKTKFSSSIEKKQDL